MPALIFASLANAVPRPPISTKPVIPIEQFKGVKYELEQEIGERLSREQSKELAQLISDDREFNLVTEVSQSPEKSIYCVGVSGAVAYTGATAKCIHWASKQIYTLKMIGIGYALQGQISALKLTVKFDSSRYADNFDPIPGSYGAIASGWTLIGGRSSFSGSSGNKTFSASAINVGVGVDLFSGVYLTIE
jgi:hypothetical protein